MEEKKELFENIPVPKALMTFAIPTIISQLINLIYNLADTFFVGRTGDPYKIAGVSLAFTLFVMTVSIANLFGIGGGGMVSRLLGIGEYGRAKKVAAFSFYGSLICSAIYSLLIGIFLTPLLRLFGASDETMIFAKQYTLLVVVLGTIPVVTSGTMAHMLRNTGYSKQASIGLSGGGILNIILDPLFMFVLFPKGMEVFAAAFATLLSNVASMIYFLYTVKRVSKRAPLSISFKMCKSISKGDAKEVVSVGVPSAILPGLYDLSNIVLNAKMAAHGDMQLAAIGIVLKIERLPNAIGIGICQGMLPLVAYNYSSGNEHRKNATINFARYLGVGITVITIIFYEIFARQIVGVFIDTSSADEGAMLALSYAITFIRIRALGSIFQFLNYHTSYCLQAMGDGKGTLIHSVARQLVFYIPLMFLFDALWGEIGLTWAVVAGELLGAITALILLEHWTKSRKIALNN